MSQLDFGREVFLKGVALFLVLVQNLGLVVVSRYARLTQSPDEQWISTTVVCCSESTKLVVSAILMVMSETEKGQEHLSGLTVRSWALMAVPGCLYCVQNNLYFVGVTNLSVSLFQVLSQTKIMTTAVFTVLILKRSISTDKWVSLVALMIGVMLITGHGDTGARGNTFVGAIAIFAACCTSGLSGVYLEKMLKDTPGSLWEKNFQLACYGVLFGAGAVAFENLDEVLAKGFFFGYNHAVIFVILLQALGGFVVAMALKFADNILKCFAVGLSVILSCPVSRILYHEGPELTDPLLGIGTILVVGATAVYSLGYEACLELICPALAAQMKPPSPVSKEEVEKLKSSSIENGEVQMVGASEADNGEKRDNDSK